MIEFKQGDLLACNTEAIVNTVNCVGVMGRGIALQFKKKYPENFKSYAEACKRGDVVIGKMFVFEMAGLFSPRLIINFPTKRHWRDPSLIEDIRSGLLDLVNVIKERRITSIAIPPLGCGLGGLEWGTVLPLIQSALADLPGINIVIFEPTGAPLAEKMAHVQKQPNMTKGRAALIRLAKRYLGGLIDLDPSLSLLELHKLMYFMQSCGEPLRLKYVKAPHGPYAENLSHVLNAIEGHYLTGYADGGDNPNKELEIVQGADENAQAFLMQYPDTIECVNRVAELVDGFETPFGMELLATVHWVAMNGATSFEDLVKHTYDWGPHKKKFSSYQIEVAYQRLVRLGWIDELPQTTSAQF